MKDFNYDRLTNNQEETKQNISEFLNKQDVVLQRTPEALFQESYAALSKEPLDYSKAIDLLEECRDAKQGISWHRFQHKDGTIDLIRDARNAKADAPPMLSSESLAIQFLNEARAAEKLLDLELARLIDAASKDKITQDQLKIATGRVNTAKEQLYTEGRNVFGEIARDKFDIKQKNFALVKVLTEAGIQKPEKKIAIAKDFGNLSDTHYHVTTITTQKDSTGKDRIVVESDSMLLGLTDVQKAQYMAIAASNPRSNIELTMGSIQIDMSWYNNLSPYVKDLVHEHAAEIAKGDKVLPTQLRNELIGIRNAYSKTTYVSTVDNHDFKMVTRTLHAGTPSFHGKEIDKQQQQAIAEENLRQLESFVEPGIKTTVNVLNSPWNPTGIDSAIGLQVGNGQAKLQGDVANTPLNAFRLFSPNDNTGYEKALIEVTKVAEQIDGLDKVAKFLKTGKDEKAARNQLESFNAHGEETMVKLQVAFKHAINAKHYMVSSHALSDPNNSNLQLSSEMKLVEFSANHGAIKKFVENNPELKGKVNLAAIVTICASGKDRTGLTETDTTRKAVNDELGFKGDEPQAIANLKSQVKGGHTQEMASLNGGTRGAHGIKKDTLPSFPKDPYKDNITGLQQNTASFNKFKFTDPNAPSFASKLLTTLAYITVVPIIIYKLGQSIGLIEKPKKFQPLSSVKEGEIITEKSVYKTKNPEIELDQKIGQAVEMKSEISQKLIDGKPGKFVESTKNASTIDRSLI